MAVTSRCRFPIIQQVPQQPGLTLRVVDREGAPWFVAKDVCAVLGLKPNKLNGSLQDHMRRLATDEYVAEAVPMLGNHRKAYLLNESGLYSLILRSEKPEAQQFRKWVTSVVLPAIPASTTNESGLYALVLGSKLPDALITREHNASRAGTGHVFTFRGDGWFNMTKAAQAFGKRADNFLANAETQEYVAAMESLVPGKSVIKAQRGNGNLPQVGTWAHPKLAVFFARWLDVKFSVWCDAVIEDILKGAAAVTITKPQRTTSIPRKMRNT
jgi:prophage antirepressor-like protein